MLIKLIICGCVLVSTSLSTILASPIETNGEKIINGTDALPGEIPYIVSLRNSTSGEHYCGASILDENHVLTAAHCVFGYSPDRFEIQYGKTNIGKKSGNIIQVEEIFLHPNYKPGNGYKNDIAVLKLQQKLAYGFNVQPILLPKAFSETPAGKEALLSGWGISSIDGDIMENLQKVKIKIYSDDECEKLHQNTGPTNRDVHICAGVPEGGKGQCSGDSGGPLVVQGRQVGVVSWSIKPCTVKGYPGVFAKVAAYVEWIKEQMLL